MRRFALLAAFWLAAGPARAARSVRPPAPEFPPNHAWLNGADLSLSRLQGRRVVLVAFLNAASMNSVRVLPALNAWWQRYNLAGLMIIGVHTPDYDFDSDPIAVKALLKHYGVQFPVVLDNEGKIWKSYSSEGWPELFLLDAKGRIAYDRLGEGGYKTFEKEIRDALGAFNGYRAPDTLALVDEPPKKDCYSATPAVYFGTRRGRPIDLNKTAEFGRELVTARDGELSFKGKWAPERDAIRLTADNHLQNSFARVVFRGSAGYVLAGKSGPATKLYVKVDDFWLHAGNAGPDVEWDDHDRSFVRLGRIRHYDIVRSPTDEMHELDIYPELEDSLVYGFEFSDFCQVPLKK